MTLAILSAKVSLARRDSNMAQQLASTLEGLGLTVRSISPSGVGIAGAVADFERIFEAPVVQSPSGTTFERPPHLPSSLDNIACSVYFPTTPEFFGTANPSPKAFNG